MVERQVTTVHLQAFYRLFLAIQLFAAFIQILYQGKPNHLKISLNTSNFTFIYTFIYTYSAYHLVHFSTSTSCPPPLPARPATASGALGKMGGSTHTLAKIDCSSPTLPGSADSYTRSHHSTASYNNQSQQFARQRIQGLNASTTSISREH